MSQQGWTDAANPSKRGGSGQLLQWTGVKLGPGMEATKSDLILPYSVGSSWSTKERNPSIWDQTSTPAFPKCKNST